MKFLFNLYKNVGIYVENECKTIFPVVNKKIARVRNCPDVPILNSLFYLCLVGVFLVVVFVVVVFVVVVVVFVVVVVVVVFVVVV